METTTVPNYRDPATPEEIWAILREISESRKELDRMFQEDRESQKELDRMLKEDRESMRELREGIRQLRESQKETDRMFKEDREESQKKLDRMFQEDRESLSALRKSMNENNRQLGGLHNSMGDLVETLFAPHLGDKFDAYNYNLRRMFRRVCVYDENHQLLTDIDILLSNTTVCMAVEVKRWLETTKHVDDHIKRLGVIRQYLPAEAKGKKLLGAIVGAVVTSEARKYAEQNGLFVLELTGEDVRLLEPPEGFQPKEWQ